jgi:succinylglutamic semialdehyde dehydrogenase
VRCFHEAGVPEGVIRLLIGGPDEGRALAGQPEIDGLLFTGSARAGQSLHKQFSDMPHKILALELGGNNPLVVWRSKHVEAAAMITVQSAYLTAGQRCTAARRLIVEQGQEGEILGEIQTLIDRMIVDHPFADPQPFMGPVIDGAAADHVQDQWLNLMMKGAKPLRRLDRPFEERPYLTPALIDVTGIKDRPDEEIFGPVLQVIRVKDFDAAIDEANNTRFGLAASLIGDSPAEYDRFWANVRAGVINWNKPTNGAPSTAPFGGLGASGNHRPSAFYAADYCAYPVTSSEADRPRASLGEGLRDPNMQED